MRLIIQALERPFILHFWDSLDALLADSDDHIWLIKNAEKVLTLSKPLRKEVIELGRQATDLLFVREPSIRSALPPSGAGLRIALIGNLEPYKRGVMLLDAAISSLMRTGLKTELIFIESRRSFEKLNLALASPVTVTGFLEGDLRDQKLASCHLAFLPGPDRAPEEDMRSRYSIPSRILDFLAVGLPIVGSVHPESATAIMSRELQLGEFLCCSTPAQLQYALSALSDSRKWAVGHLGSLAAFENVNLAGQIATLKNALDGHEIRLDSEVRVSHVGERV